MNVNLIKSGATYATKRAAYYETLETNWISYIMT